MVFLYKEYLTQLKECDWVGHNYVPGQDGMVLHQSMMDDVVICLCTEPNCKTKVLELFQWRLRHSFSVLRHALAVCQEQWEYFLEFCGANSGCKVSPLA